MLVVDDEEGIRDLLSRTLALAEYDVDTSSDGESALESIRNDGYKLLIADLRMPGMDGLTLIREVKQINRTCRSSSSPGTRPNRRPSRP